MYDIISLSIVRNYTCYLQ